ncbi:hypothetical protein ACLESD_12805 [Pyxidicoccus sp. 3LFB2]
MLSLALVLVLSQLPPPPSPEAVARFEADKAVLIPALVAKYACAKPSKKPPHPLCDAAQGGQKGTAAEVRGKNALVGLTWAVRRGKSGKVEVSAPRLSGLALNKDSVGVWSAITDITPQDAEEKRMLGRFTQDLASQLEGRKASVARPAAVTELLTVWSGYADHLLEKKDTAWVFKGTPITLHKVGERWVLLGAPKSGEGIVLSVFVP